MPEISIYEDYPDHNRLDHDRFTFSSIYVRKSYFDKSNIIFKNKKFSLYKGESFDAIRYILVVGNKILDSFFDSRGYIKKDKLIAMMDVTKKTIKSINLTYKVNTYQIEWVYTSDTYRGQGYGKMIYDCVIEDCGSLLSGDILHSNENKVTGSWRIWRNYLPTKYSCLNYSVKNKKFYKFNPYKGYNNKKILFYAELKG